MADLASLRQLPDSSDSSTAFTDVILSGNPRSIGRGVTLTVPGIERTGALVGARLVRSPATAWLDYPVAV